MNIEKKGYWIYSVIAIIFGFGLFGWFGYLVYDLIIKLSEKDFSNNTVIQALITLIVTVFIGGYFSKWLELRNNKKIELYEIRSDISLKIIDLASAYYHNQNENIRNLLIAESSKVKLYFDDEVLKNLNIYLESNKKDKDKNYESLIDSLRKSVK